MPNATFLGHPAHPMLVVAPAALNVGLLAASATNLVLRTRGEDAAGRLPFALGAIGALGVFVSSWFGGHLVFELGVRVKGRGERASALERQRGRAPLADQDVAPWQGPSYAAVEGEPAEGPFH